MKKTAITMNLDGLENLIGRMSSEYVTRVGVLGSGAMRDDGDGVTNADLALIHIYGSLSGDIPPRDFLKMPLEMKKKELMKTLETGAVKTAIAAGDYERVFELIGIGAEAIVDGAFKSAGYGQWPANAPATVRAKGSSAPLIDTGELRRSVTSDVVKRSDL